MNLWRLLPAFKPRHTFASVVQELVQGLRDGRIVLEKKTPERGPILPPAGDHANQTVPVLRKLYGWFSPGVRRP
jgi:hypothetical protein